MERVRPAAVAGSFYPAEAEELKELLDDCFVASPLGPRGAREVSPSLVGAMVPHAGYAYSGPCAAHLYASLDKNIRQVILLGVNHRGRGSSAALSAAEFWRTPLGEVPVDRAAGERLKSRIDFLAEDDRPHRDEHSIEVQLPFLQSVLREFAFVPLSLSYLTLEECRRLGEAVARAYEAGTGAGTKTLLLASSDLNHYLSPKETERLDALALEKILALDPVGLLESVEENNISMCGVIPTAVLLFAANALGAKQARLLKHCHSGDVARMREVVGYASVALEF
jgi:AmmeMemoRadiSam system protein B